MLLCAWPFVALYKLQNAHNYADNFPFFSYKFRFGLAIFEVFGLANMMLTSRPQKNTHDVCCCRLDNGYSASYIRIR